MAAGKEKRGRMKMVKFRESRRGKNVTQIGPSLSVLCVELSPFFFFIFIISWPLHTAYFGIIDGIGSFFFRWEKETKSKSRFSGYAAGNNCSNISQRKGKFSPGAPSRGLRSMDLPGLLLRPPGQVLEKRATRSADDEMWSETKVG